MRPIPAVLLLLLAASFSENVFAQAAAERPRRSAVLRGAAAVESIELSSQGGRQAAAILSPVTAERLKALERVEVAGSTVIDVPFLSLTTPQLILALKLRIDAEPGLRCTRRGCGGIVRVGLNDSVRINERFALPAPVPIQVYGPDLVEPDTFSITLTHVMRPVRVHTVAQTAVLKVRAANFDPAEIPLTVQKVQLSMNPASGTIDRFGLETTELHIGAIEGLDPSDTVVVRLEAEGVRVEPSRVEVTSTNGATVKLRSRNRSAGTVKAITSSYVTTTPVNVALTFPWWFLLFTLLGGVTGGFFRQTFFGGDGTKSQKAGRVVASALMGVALTLLLVLGFNLLGIPLPVGDASEPAGFAVGAVAAVIADTVASIWRRTPSQAEPPKPREHQPA